jgi:glutathione reductase (NADPH)
MAKHFDLLIIGAGGGGIATAEKAALYGAKVALVEMDHFGGTCVNVGCIPKKIMWYAAQLDEYFRLGFDYGYPINARKLDFATLVNRREQYIKSLRQKNKEKFEKTHITYIKGCARFLDQKTMGCIPIL